MLNTGQTLGRIQGIAWLTAGAAVLGMTALGTIWWLASTPPAAVLAKSSEVNFAGPGGPLPPEPVHPSPPQPPNFDIVRVSPEGAAVIAGRAAEDAEISVRDGDHEIGRTSADEHGQWAITPDRPLLPGSHELTITSRLPSGETVDSDASVLLMIPARQTTNKSTLTSTIAVLLPSTPGSVAAPHVLQPPRPSNQASLGLDLIAYNGKGGVRFAGRAQPGAAIVIYVDNVPHGDALADAEGAWTLQPGREIPHGRHMLRLEQISRGGQVRARAEMPFEQEPAASPDATATVAGQTVLVQPGETLWRIARRAYGEGTRYTTIFAANHDRIGDPALIYPGQIFAVPITPAPSGRSSPDPR